MQAVSGPDELIVAPDVRAHGGFLAVGGPADFELDRLAAEVCEHVPAALAEAGHAGLEASEPVTVIGISMGAALALRIALDGLLPVRRAVFVRPAFDDRSLPDNLRPFPVIGQILADAGPAGAAEFQERAVFQQVAAASPAGGRALLAQFQAPDAARRAMRLVEIPRNRAFADDAELAELDARGIRSLVVGGAPRPGAPVPDRGALGRRPARDARAAAGARRRAGGADGGAARARRALAAAGLAGTGGVGDVARGGSRRDGALAFLGRAWQAARPRARGATACG